MAGTSPAPSNNSSDNLPSAAAFNFNLPPPTANMSKNLRGLNKPKCIQCGNVARSRCPFQSCKNCCSKAQNPCEIHVLKGISNAPDKTASSNSAKVDQQPTDVSHSGTSHRGVSLRQLSNTFAQFNNLSAPARSKKPLTRKDAELINEWRFLKLKEFRETNIEAEDEAFDRYVRNVSLLEEVFCVNSSLEGQSEGSSAAKSEDGAAAVFGDYSLDDNYETMVAGLKLKLRSDPDRAENFRKRMQYIVDLGLKDVNRSELFDGNAGGINITDPSETGRRPKKLKSWRAERAAIMAELTDKLDKARNLEDLNACFELKDRLKKLRADSKADGKSSQNYESDALDKPAAPYSPPKWFKARPVTHETLVKINEQFSALEDIEDL